jgi:bacterial/archaeal transporter family-2 protein
MIFFLIIVTVLIGTLMPFQAAINAELTKLLKHPYLGAFISFFTGTLVLAFIIIFQRIPLGDLKRLTLVPPYYYLGGLMGALFVGSSIFLIPRLGATTMMAAFVAGQLIMSIIMDHYGLLGLPTYPVTTYRVLGVIMLFLSLLLIVKKSV